jgi:hypothetical protein
MLAIEAASIIDGDVVGDNLILTKHDGNTINAGNVRGAAGPAGPAGPAGSYTSIPIVTALPTTGLTDGKEIYFQTTAMATAGLVYHLRYRLTNPDGSTNFSSYKWEVICVADLESYIFAPESRAQNGVWGDVATVGPSITVPLAGDYDIAYGGSLMSSGGSGTPEAAVGLAFNNVEDTNLRAYAGWNSVAGGTMSTARQYRKTALAAGTVIKLIYGGNSTGGTVTASRRWLRIRPIRVG